MNDLDQIKNVITAYADAAKRADMQTLAGLCTPAMLRQFTFTFRVGIKLASFLTPKRFSDLSPDNIEVEKQENVKAVVSYTTTFGKRRQYERVVLLKEDNQWRIDGKYA